MPDLDTIPMTRDEVLLLIRIEPVLRRLGLSLYCKRCHALGIPDGVQGNNDAESHELTVACGCSVRRYLRDTPHQVGQTH